MRKKVDSLEENNMVLLINEAKKGNAEAITKLYEACYKNVYFTIRSMISDEDTVLDLTQDTFIKAFSSLDQLDNPAKFNAWIKTIGRNLAVNHLRAKKPMLFSEIISEENEGDYELTLEDDKAENSPEIMTDREETARLIKEILGTLSESQRLVVGMFYYEEMSVKEISEQTGMSESSVKVHLHKGRKRIEEKVRALEKQGTKLYSLSPLPFLLWLLRSEAAGQVSVPSVSAVLGQLSVIKTAASGTKSAAGIAQKGLKFGHSKHTVLSKYIGSSVARKSVIAAAGLSVAAAGAVYSTNAKPDLSELNEKASQIYELFKAGEYGEAGDLLYENEDLFFETYNKKCKNNKHDYKIWSGPNMYYSPEYGTTAVYCDNTHPDEAIIISFPEKIESSEENPGYGLMISYSDGQSFKQAQYWTDYDVPSTVEIFEADIEEDSFKNLKSMENMFETSAYIYEYDSVGIDDGLANGKVTMKVTADSGKKPISFSEAYAVCLQDYDNYVWYMKDGKFDFDSMSKNGGVEYVAENLDQANDRSVFDNSDALYFLDDYGNLEIKSTNLKKDSQRHAYYGYYESSAFSTYIVYHPVSENVYYDFHDTLNCLLDHLEK